jgi:hypothetical protein
MVDEKGNLTRFASRKGLPSRGLSRNMREILSLKLPLVRSPLMKIKKPVKSDQLCFILVDEKGIEPSASALRTRRSPS